MRRLSKRVWLQTGLTLLAGLSAIVAVINHTNISILSLFVGLSVMFGLSAVVSGQLLLGGADRREYSSLRNQIRKSGGSGTPFILKKVNARTEKLDRRLFRVDRNVEKLNDSNSEALKRISAHQRLVLRKIEQMEEQLGAASNRPIGSTQRQSGAKIKALNGATSGVKPRLARPRQHRHIVKLQEYLLESQAEINDPPMATEIPVAIIADEFTYYSLAPEFKSFRLTPDNWKEIFTKYQPKLFFCESAWNGGNGKFSPWAGMIYASNHKPEENRGVLLEIINHCRKNNIPTVFWNKEDPVNFSNRTFDFPRTAALFDFVFTSAKECVSLYEQDLAIPFPDVLPFAVQPKIFNPQNIADASDSANFAGTWYMKYPERGAAATQIMDHVLEAGLDLVIYDRMYQSASEKYVYPEKFIPYTRPSIPYYDVAQSYKESKYGITLNTVTNSETMFARRVFELAASGSVVLSNDAEGVRKFFGDSVIYADVQSNPLLELDEDAYKAYQEAAMRIAFANTYTHRAEEILTAAGIKYKSYFEKPTLILTKELLEMVRDASKEGELNNFSNILVIGSTQQEEQAFEGLGIPIDFVDADFVSEPDLFENSVSASGALTFFDSADVLPNPDDIQYLQAHALHFDGAVTFAREGNEKYSRGMTVENGTFFVAKKNIIRAISGKSEVFYV